MKKRKEKTCLLDSQKITLENVKELGEKFAMSALQNMRRFHGNKIDLLYKGLIKDVFHFNKNGNFTDGYNKEMKVYYYI